MILDTDTLGDMVHDNRFTAFGGLITILPGRIVKSSELMAAFSRNRRAFKTFLSPIGYVEPTSHANCTLTSYDDLLSMNEDRDLEEHCYTMTGNSYMLERDQADTQSYIDGVPANFVNSFGNF
jgi:hypothetical protein